jgi:hypothetical protein
MTPKDLRCCGSPNQTETFRSEVKHRRRWLSRPTLLESLVFHSEVKRFTLFHSAINQLTRCPATIFHLFQSVLAK